MPGSDSCSFISYLSMQLPRGTSAKCFSCAHWCRLDQTNTLRRSYPTFPSWDSMSRLCVCSTMIFFLQRLKGIVHSKMKILTSFTHPHVISNITFFLMENTNGDVSQIKITQVWVNDRIFIFGWTIPLSLCKETCGGKMQTVPLIHASVAFLPTKPLLWGTE